MSRIVLSQIEIENKIEDWMRITASLLEEWKIYLHNNVWGSRYIIEIDEEWYVLYQDEYGSNNYYKKENFTRSCPYETSDEKCQFLFNKEYYKNV